MTDADPTTGQQGSNERLTTVVARALGGAVFFSLPLLMTMEMWWLGFYMQRTRIALFLVLMIPLLIGLSHFSGIRRNTTWTDDVADVFVAYGVAFAASLLVLSLFDIVDFSSMPIGEIVGKVSLQAVPASFGAMLANSQLGSSADQGKEEERKERGGYRTELFLMSVGAIFLAFNVAPTEEMVLIAFKMSTWHATALVLVTVGMMHGFVYSARFRGTPKVPEGTPWWHLFLRFTIVGYAVALLASAYVLWTFGRFEENALVMYLMMTVVLGFPAGLGAAAARLVL